MYKNFKELKNNIISKVVLSFAVVTLATVQVDAYNLKLSDVSGHWAQKPIEKLIEMRYINGYDDDTFRPNNAITRAEFISLVNRVFNYKTKSNVSFSDVSPDAWYYNEIAIAISNGYINGYDDNTFKPNKYISRQEASLVFDRLLKSTQGLSGIVQAVDLLELPSWSSQEVIRMIRSGLLIMYNGEVIAPTDEMSRAEVAYALEKIQRQNFEIEIKSIVDANPNLNLTYVPSSQKELKFLEEARKEMLRLINDHRMKNGVRKLKYDENINSTAYEWANYCAYNKHFAHANLDGLYVWDVFPTLGIRGENLTNKMVSIKNKEGMLTSKGALEVASKHFNSWKNSPGHNTNMLNPEWTHFGYGIGFNWFDDGMGYGELFKAFGCQQFSSRKS